MSTSIEQRVVQMRFDNKQFEQGVAQSMSTLDKLKAKLNFKDAGKDFDELNRAANKVDISQIGDQADKVGVKFDAMAVVAMTALQRMTNAAINAGTSMVKSLSVDQITAGWTKYEQKTGSVQTIMNATGKSIDEVNGYLDKLMWFSDETSYGFNDMTAAIGQLTSAGGDIDSLVPMVMGIANATAFAGKGVNEFSRSIYNLNQSYSAGYLQYMDWKSLELAGVASKQLKEVFIETAEELGKVNKGAITLANFGSTLKDKWADTEVMEKAFGKFGEMTEKAYEMVQSGMVETASEAYEILSQTYTGYSITAAKAAQEAKSFQEAVDATKDAVSSGWMKTFEIIFGNYEEAKVLWTDLANTMWDLFASGADSRNEMLQAWKDLGGRSAAINAVKWAFQDLMKVLEAVQSAFRDIFPPMTAEQLFNITLGIKQFMKYMQLSDEAVNTLRVAVKALLIPFKLLAAVIEVGIFWAAKLILQLKNLVDEFLALPSKITAVNNPLKNLFGDDRYERIVKALSTIVSGLGEAFSIVAEKIGSVISTAKEFISSRFGDAFERLIEALEPIADWILDRIVDGFEALAKFDYSKISDWAVNAIDALATGFGIIGGACKLAIDAVKDFFSQFEGMTALQVLDSILNSVANLKTNMMTFIKSLGFDQIMNQLKVEAGGVAEVIATLGEAVQSMVAKLTPAKIVVFSFGVSLVWIFTNLAQAIAAFQKIATGIVGVMTGITGVLKAFQQRLKGSKILQIAVAIGVLAISLGALSMVDSDKLTTAAIALGSLMLLLGLLVAGMAAVNKFLVGSDKMAENLLKVAKVMVMFAASVAILAGALILLGKIEMDRMWEKLAVLGVIMVALGAASVAVAKLAPELTKGAAFLLLFSLSIATIVGSLDKLASANLEGIEKNILGLAAVIALLAGLSVAASHMSFGSAAGITLMVLDILLFIKVLEKISDIDIGSLAQGIIVVTLTMTLMALLGRLATVGVGKNSKVMTPSFLGMAAAIVALALVIRMLAGMSTAEIAQGLGVITACMLLFAVITEVTKVADKGSKAASPAFLAMAGSILLLAVAINYLGKLDQNVVIQGGVVVGAILTLFAILTKVAGTAKGATGSISAMAVALGLITASIVILTLIPFEEAIKAAGSLSLAIVALGAAMHLMNGLDLKTAIGAIAMLVAVMLSLKYMMRVLQDSDMESLVSIATSMGIIFVTLGAAMALMGKGGGFDLSKIGGTIAMMASMLTVVTVMFALLNSLPYNEGTIEKAFGLGIVMNALALAMKFVRITTAKPENITKTLGMMLGMLAMSTAVFAILTYLPLGEGMIEKTISLSILLGVLSGCIALLSAIAPALIVAGNSWAAAIKGIAVIGVGLLAVAALVVWATGFLSDIEDLDERLDNGVLVLGKLGEMIGSFVGNLVGGVLGGVASGITSQLPQMGQDFADFATNVKPFLELEVPSGLVSSIGALVEIAGQLAGQAFINAIDFWNGEDTPLSKFGQQLAEFGPYVAQFGESVKDVNASKMNAAARAMEGIGALLNAIPTEGGLMNMIFGEKSLKTFGEGLQEFAVGFVGYCQAIEDDSVTGDVVTKTKNIAEAMKLLADSIPSSGGLLQDFFGSKEIDKFGQQLADYALGLQEFFMIITGQKEDTIPIDNKVVTETANASKALAEFAKDIPSAGGELQKFFGSKDMGVFGTQLVQFAGGLMSFFRLVDEEKVSEDSVALAISLGEAFRDFAETLPTAGGLWQSFVGGQDLGVFGQSIKSFGDSLVSFFDTFGQAEITDADIELAKKAGLAFSEILSSTPDYSTYEKLFGSSDEGAFKNGIINLGSALLGYYQKVRQINFEQVDTSVATLKNVISLNESIKDLSEGSANVLRDYLVGLATDSINGFVDAFADAGDKFATAVSTAMTTAFTQASENISAYAETYDVLIDALVYGTDTNMEEVLVKAQEICTKFNNAIHEEWQQLEEAGSFFVVSLITGISQNEGELVISIKTLVGTMVDTLHSALAIEAGSSGKFEDAGEACIQGLTKGFEKNQTTLMTKVKNLANNVLTTFNNTVGYHSPWSTMVDAGEALCEGLDIGIGDGTDGLLDTVSGLGESILGEYSDVFDIDGDVSLETYDIGDTLDVSLGDGILDSDYSVNAAASKADQIVGVFQERFKNISSALSILDKEFEVWAAANPMYSYSDGVNTVTYGQGAYNQKQMELLNNKMALQAERVNMANAQYQATLAKMGEGSQATLEAYDAYLDEQLSMLNLTNQFQQFEAQNRENFVKYAEVLSSIHDGMIEAGFSEEEIRKSVADQTGWVNTAGMTGANQNIQGMVDAYTQQATSVESLLSEAMSAATETAASNATQSGTQTVSNYAQGVTSAVQNGGLDGATSAISGAISDAVGDGISDSEGAFSGSLTNLIEGGINGASAGIDKLKNWMTGAADQGIGAFNSAAGIQSPSTVMYESGVNLMEGLANGIGESMALPVESSTNVANSTTQVFLDSAQQYPSIGQNMMAGLANGIASGASSVINAAVQVAQAAIAAAQAALGVHSPSRVFYKIGEMIDQGLSNGILDEYAIVDGSISKIVERMEDVVDTEYQIRAVVDVDDDDVDSWTFPSNAILIDGSGNIVPRSEIRSGYGSPNGMSAEWIKVDSDTAKYVYDQIRENGWNYDSFNDTMKELVDTMKYGTTRADLYNEKYESATEYNFTQIINTDKTSSAAENARRMNNMVGELEMSSNETIHGGKTISSK